MRTHDQEITGWIAAVFRMIGRGIDQVAVFNRVIPGSHHSSVSWQPLEAPQRVLLERDIEEHFHIVKQGHLFIIHPNDVTQHSRYLQGSLPLGEVQQLPAQLEVHVDVANPVRFATS